MVHIPVLLEEVVAESNIKSGDIMVDGTLGLGGHSNALFFKANKKLKIIAFDKDNFAISKAKEVLQDASKSLTIFNSSFVNLKESLKSIKVNYVDLILLDLGLSSIHLDEEERGFTFLKNQPLDMNMDENGYLKAYDVINFWKEESLYQIIKGFGEERYAKGIAKNIVLRRKEKDIKTTFDLVEIIKSSVPKSYLYGKIHPATKTFQAIRIAVNNELEELSKVIEDGVHLLNKDKRFMVITFHSLEDRIVKNKFKELEKEGFGYVVTKKPIIPKIEEIKKNNRSRSAKLRIFQRV
jgi:16S rRNA (cytosine1402-N4)-methyltransferase